MTGIDIADQIKELLEALGSPDPTERLAAIQILGEIGDEEALRRLRERLVKLNQEMYVLVVAVGELKKRLGKK